MSALSVVLGALSPAVQSYSWHGWDLLNRMACASLGFYSLFSVMVHQLQREYPEDELPTASITIRAFIRGVLLLRAVSRAFCFLAAWLYLLLILDCLIDCIWWHEGSGTPLGILGPLAWLLNADGHELSHPFANEKSMIFCMNLISVISQQRLVEVLARREVLLRLIGAERVMASTICLLLKGVSVACTPSKSQNPIAEFLVRVAPPPAACVAIIALRDHAMPLGIAVVATPRMTVTFGSSSCLILGLLGGAYAAHAVLSVWYLHRADLDSAALRLAMLAHQAMSFYDAAFTVALPSPSRTQLVQQRWHARTSSKLIQGPNWQPQAMLASASAGVGAVAACAQRRPRPFPRSQIKRRAFFDFASQPSKKTVIITGASSGLGLAAAKELVKSGEWRVILACRDFVKAERVARENNFPQENYLVLHLDLAANSSVRQFVTTFRSLNIPLDALVCNAAVYFPNAHKEGAFFPGLFPGGGPRWSADGHELSFATNYLGHFLLCNLLLEDLKKSTVKPARCIILGTVTASINDKEVGGMIPPVADLGDLKGLESGMQKPTTMIDNGRFNGAKAYKDSKVCDVMLMRELHKRHHASTGIAFSSLYPGCIADTNLFREHYPVFRFLFPILQREVTNAYVSEEEAGRRLAKCVADPAYAQSGVYFSWGGESGTGGAGGTDAVENMDASNDRFLQYGSFRTLKESEIGGDAGDDARCKRLWEFSEKLVGERFS
ncbi:unnamed protein product [Durusdinium trenchii]|uniref:protochlorophyllide reductase n=2 Tax=Durusdinium trenchii TaxID=1381693 RepID=A0ABP0JB12_9DINO